MDQNLYTLKDKFKKNQYGNDRWSIQTTNENTTGRIVQYVRNKIIYMVQKEDSRNVGGWKKRLQLNPNHEKNMYALRFCNNDLDYENSAIRIIDEKTVLD